MININHCCKQRNPCVYHHPHRPFMKGALSEINTGDPIFYLKHRMDGTTKVVYHKNIIDLLDRVFIADGLRFLSEEQERFMSMFFEQAGEATGKLEAGSAEPFADMDDAFRQLDYFLGNYRGNCYELYNQQMQ